MELVLLSALGVGGATVIGAVIGFLFRNISARFSEIMLSFAAGVMLAAAMLGLVLPAMELGGSLAPITVSVGIMTGAACISILDRFVPSFQPFITGGAAGKGVDRVLLFVTAIAIHNLPEGIAAGVGFGTGNVSDALFIAGGIALQNLPEGMVIISPMLNAGISVKRTMGIAILTGVTEVVGTLIGFFAASLSRAILPFLLAFAGGTMVYVISDEMIPEAHSGGNRRWVSYALLIGFCLMLAVNHYL